MNELFGVLNEWDKISAKEDSGIKSNLSDGNEKKSVSQENSSILSL